ncbi:IS4 family transposase [Anaerorudis cellulosivorans]|uniref:IS4 family transposase n=1 Tax=Anaerorudis cellulosivorans TaxID=3397862 RepID=UPI00221EAB1E|nr:IS4 family transposase [Seramator thermalis]MCW1735058.1 IS4 family transposase [Seramator thermalis]
MNSGKTVFSQIMQLVPRREFNETVARYKGDFLVRNLFCCDQFFVMCMAQYADKNSLRDIEATLNALAAVRKLYHCGISYVVPPNTLATANENSDLHIYAELGEVLIKKVRPIYAKDKFRLDIDNMIYAFDSTTIGLCLKLCPWAKFRKNKGGIKIHAQIDLRGNLPVFIHLARASVYDISEMDEMCIEMGAIYLMDKGYVDFFRLFNNIHKNGAFFLTGAKDNMQYEVVSSGAVDSQTGVISDQIIRLTEEASIEKYPDELRMVVYEDFAGGNVYRFITNHTGYEALTIAELYRERWNVELFFKWIKQQQHNQIILRYL